MKTSLSTVALGLVLAVGCDLAPGSIGDETQGETTEDTVGEPGCGDACGAGEQCILPVGSCAADPAEAGSCRPVPEACYLLYAPVCGCDGVTYGNDCDAELNGVSIAHEGECGGGMSGGSDSGGTTSTTGGDPTDPTAGDTDGGTDGGTGGDTGTGEMCDGFAGFECPDGEYCYHEPGVCIMIADALGECQVPPDACTLILDPVCGCDGETYDNACAAAMAGVSVAYEAECDAGDQQLCMSTGGSWILNSCGHYDCGVPPACAAVIPGCDCGDNANFVEGVGCMADMDC